MSGYKWLVTQPPFVSEDTILISLFYWK